MDDVGPQWIDAHPPAGTSDLGVTSITSIVINNLDTDNDASPEDKKGEEEARSELITKHLLARFIKLLSKTGYQPSDGWTNGWMDIPS